MNRRPFAPFIATAFAACLLAASPLACSKVFGSSEAVETLPAAPSFDGWTLKSDTLVPRNKITQVEFRLNGMIKDLRNVIYEVNGKKVQVNVILPQSPADAEKIFKKLSTLKPTWATQRKGDVIYEFVGEDESMNDIQKARATLGG